MAVELRALGKLWGELSDDGRYLELRRHDCRVARVDLVESARAGRTVLCDPGRARVRSAAQAAAGVSRETGGAG